MAKGTFPFHKEAALAEYQRLALGKNNGRQI
jgi:hypothetical protein